MPRNDKPILIEEPTTEEEMQELEKLGVPHYMEIDPALDAVVLSLPVANALMGLERPLSAVGLFFIYLIYNKLHNKMPTVKELTEMGVGSAPKIASIRKTLTEQGFLRIHIVRKDGKIVAKHTYLTSPKLKNLNIRKHGGIIINNNITPDSERTESGCSSSCSCHGGLKKEEKTPKKFPREQDFNALWEMNRRKINKDEARKAWKSRPVQKHLPPKDVLLEAYEADAASSKWDDADQQYIPHLSTWLRNKRWENHTGELKGEGGGVHIMDQLRRSDGIENARQLRAEILEEHKARTKTGFRGKSAVRVYVKWLAGPDSPPATSRDSIKDVLVTDRAQSRYWNAYVGAGMPGMTKKEEV